MSPLCQIIHSKLIMLAVGLYEARFLVLLTHVMLLELLEPGKLFSLFGAQNRLRWSFCHG